MARGDMRPVNSVLSAADMTDDDWHPLEELDGTEAVGGSFQVKSNSAEFILSPKKPEANATGQTFPPGSFLGLDALDTIGTGVRLNHLWFKNTAPGSDAVVVLNTMGRQVDK